MPDNNFTSNVENSRLHRTVLILVLTVHTCLLGYAAWWMSPTLDEPAHMVAGLSHWRYGDFSLYRVNPPLVLMVATLPALLTGYQFDFPDMASVQVGRPEFNLGESFINGNGLWALWLTTLGRWACIPFSWIGAFVCYRWAKDLYGMTAGLWACSLWCFSPMVLGHAALLTPDAHAAALGELACYTFWRWLRKPTWHRAVSTGLILGVAELSKSTLILLGPIWPALWLLYRWSQDLLHLERWTKTRSVNAPVYLAFDDFLNPFDFCIAHIAPWPFQQSPTDTSSSIAPAIGDGWYAISINQLYEFPNSLRQPDGSQYDIDRRPLRALRGIVPFGWAGYSIRIYSAEQIRTAYATLERQ